MSPDGQVRSLREPLWQAAAGFLMGVGLSALLARWGWQAVGIWLTCGTSTALFHAVMWPKRDPRAITVAGVCGGVVLCAFLGLLDLWPVVLIPAALLAGTAPWVLEWLRPRLDGARARLGLAVGDRVSYADLRLAWESSGAELHPGRSLESRLRTVEFRALILDELSRRDTRPSPN